MDQTIKRIFLCSLLILQVSCSSSPEKKEGPNPYLVYPAELEKANEQIEEGKEDDALLLVNSYLGKSENIHWFGHAYFLKAYLAERKGDLDKAVSLYRSAIRHGMNYESGVAAQAMYNLSFVFERKEDWVSMLPLMLDLMKKRAFFNALVGTIEIPARLAAVYASQGQLKDALRFHQEAASQFNRQVRSSQFRYPSEDISKALYYLGLSTFDQNQENFVSLLNKLKAGQKYFLGAAEASKSQWSVKASKRLRTQWNKAWGQVLAHKPKTDGLDPIALKRKTHNEQLIMASEFYDLMHAIKVEEFPLGNVNPRSKVIMESADKWMDKTEDFALTLDLGPQMTRSKKIKNKKLSQFIEMKEQPVRVNKEAAQAPPSSSKIPAKAKKLEKKQEIGKDPNL